jgi:polyhydroxyalkanoate synthesis regulator phasin
MGSDALKERLLLAEQVATGKMSLDEARRRRTEVLRQTRRGRLLLRIERIEKAVKLCP